MKTQIMALDHQDDVVSIRDKMQWAKAPRLLLVFPHKQSPSLRSLDLLLLQRHATRLGVQLGLVSRSAQLRRAAAEKGIPIFTSAVEAQNVKWPDQQRQPSLERRDKNAEPRVLRKRSFPSEASWRRNRVIRSILFTLAVSAILAILITLIPSATITISPKHEIQSATLSLSASPETGTISAAGEIPSFTTTVTLEGSKTASINTTASIPDQPSEGMVRFTNLSMAVVGIPADTIVRTLTEPTVRFSILQDGVLAGELGKTIELPVRALDPGQIGNIPANTLLLVEGSLGASISATNPEPITGGSDRQDQVPSADDRKRLREALMVDLRRQAIEQLNEILEPGSIVFPDTIAPEAPLEENYTPEPGQPGNLLSLKISGKFSVEYASGSDITALGTVILDAGLPTGYEDLPETLTFNEVRPPITDAYGVTSWTINLERVMRLHIDPIIVPVQVQGRRPAVALQRLAVKYPLEKAPEIKITPSFWPWLPLTSLRIAIIIE